MYCVIRVCGIVGIIIRSNSKFIVYTTHTQHTHVIVSLDLYMCVKCPNYYS
jgi:hypothetical protein